MKSSLFHHFDVERQYHNTTFDLKVSVAQLVAQAEMLGYQV